MPFGLHVGLDNASLTNTVLATVGAGAFVASACKRPQVGIYFLVPLLPLQTLRLRLGDIPLGAQMIDITLLGIIIGLWRRGEAIISRTHLTRCLIGFFVFTYLSLWQGAFYLGSALPAWITDPRFSDWKNYMVIYLIYFLTYSAIQTRRQVTVVIILIGLSILILNRTYLHTISGRDFSAFSDDIREAGAIGYCGVNGLAALEAQVTAFFVALFCCHKNLWARLAYSVVFVSSAYCLMFTLSRGGYLALLASLLFIGIVRSRLILLGTIAFLLTWQTFVPGAVSQRVFMTKSESGQLESSAGTRVALWRDALDTFVHSPATGLGLFTYKYRYHLGEYRDTHNYYVKCLLEMGCVGLLYFLVILRKFFSTGWSLFRTFTASDFSRGIGLGLASLMVAAAIANVFGDRWAYIEITGFTCAITALALRFQSLEESCSLDISVPDMEDDDTTVLLSHATAS